MPLRTLLYTAFYWDSSGKNGKIGLVHVRRCDYVQSYPLFYARHPGLGRQHAN